MIRTYSEITIGAELSLAGPCKACIYYLNNGSKILFAPQNNPATKTDLNTSPYKFISPDDFNIHAA